MRIILFTTSELRIYYIHTSQMFKMLITNNDKEQKKLFSRILVNKFMILYIYKSCRVREYRT